MLRRNFTLEEVFRWILAGTIRDTIDRELGDAMLAICNGDDTAFAKVHDRLNVLGNFDGADRIRKLINERNNRP